MRAAGSTTQVDVVTPSIETRVAALDWAGVGAALQAQGVARMPGLLSPRECAALATLYDDDALFRSRVVMGHHGFGRGEYRYFGYPLPDPIAALRQWLYAHLAPIADAWQASMGIATRFPSGHSEFLARCHLHGQRRATPLLLRYGPGDYNCLHQDLCGEQVFPIQVTLLLSQPQRDFSGGEFVVTEQRPRMQSRALVVPLEQGDAIAFAVRHRPVRGARGTYRVNMRHGVSQVHCGRRHALGLIFHDAA